VEGCAKPAEHRHSPHRELVQPSTCAGRGPVGHNTTSAPPVYTFTPCWCWQTPGFHTLTTASHQCHQRPERHPPTHTHCLTHNDQCVSHLIPLCAHHPPCTPQPTSPTTELSQHTPVVSTPPHPAGQARVLLHRQSPPPLPSTHWHPDGHTHTHITTPSTVSRGLC